LKHPGEKGAWEFTHLWHKLRPVAGLGEGIGMTEAEIRRGDLSNGNVALLINMAKNGGIPWDHCFSGETFHHYKPDSGILSRRGQDDVSRAPPGDAVRGAQWRPESRPKVRPVDRLRPSPEGARPPTRKTDLKADGDWDAVGHSMIELAQKIGC